MIVVIVMTVTMIVMIDMIDCHDHHERQHDRRDRQHDPHDRQHGRHDRRHHRHDRRHDNHDRRHVRFHDHRESNYNYSQMASMSARTHVRSTFAMDVFFSARHGSPLCSTFTHTYISYFLYVR